MFGLITTRFQKYPLAGDVLAILAGFAFPLSLSPYNFWIAGVISILGLLLSVEQASLRRGMLRFYLFNVAMFVFGISWVYVSIHDHGGASEMLAGGLVLLFAAALSLIGMMLGFVYLRWFRLTSLGRMLGFPAIWVIKEWVFTWFLTGFPWLFIGYGHLETPLSGYAPILGVLGVSFLVVLTVSLVNEALRTRGANAIKLLAVMLSLWGVGYGLQQLSFVSPAGEPITVSTVQGNIDQNTKWTRAMVIPIINTYRDLTESEWGRDLIVWPEAAITLFKGSAEDLLDGLDRRGKKDASTLVLGIPDRDAGAYYNTAVAVGLGEGQYVKRRLVPFGEYLPLESLLRGLIDFFDLPMSRNHSGPWHQPLLTAAGLKLGMSICYEIVYPNIVRQNASVPDVLITISNDTWFGHSIGPKQHMQMAQMRALENGRYLIRATNNGISAIVNERGQIEARLPQFEAGVLRGEVRPMEGVTPYTRFGDLPIVGFVFVLLALVLGYNQRSGRMIEAK